tara:strand:- start:31960 stop:32928 length:969 start_codon:yes stop_codon:yes gene_type:complete
VRFIVFLLLGFFSCAPTDCRKKKDLISKEINFNDLTGVLKKIDNMEEFSELILSNSEVMSPFFELQTPLIEDDVSQIFSLIDNVYFDSLYFDVKKTFDDFIEIYINLNNSFHLYNRDSDFKLQPELNILVSGFYNDVVVSKKSIIVGIEYFLEHNNKYKPSDLPEYILDRYTPVHLNSTLLKSYFSQFNLINESDQSMLNEMIAFGKLYYVVGAISECDKDNIILGYSENQFEILEENEAFIYSYFIQNELFFEKQSKEKQKYMSERPYTYEISPQVPGRIGRWLGWKIVSSYMNRNQLTLEELLLEVDFKKIFYNSNYKPS